MASNTLVLVYETEQHCRERLLAQDITDEHAIEISSYLAQSTDMMPEFSALEKQCAAHGLRLIAQPLRDFACSWQLYDPEHMLIWTLTDGIAFFSGSTSPLLANLAGIPRIGAELATFVHCQDKFRTGSILTALGVSTPSQALTRNGVFLSPRAALEHAQNGYFVKPNRLGAKIGIYTNSHCTNLEDALQLSRRIYADYHDDAVIQTYVPGVNVRASFLDLNGAGISALSQHLGMSIVDTAKDQPSTSDFQTMADSMALYGDTGAEKQRQGLYTEPVLIDLRTRSPQAAEAIIRTAETVMRALGLRDVFSMDFRVDLESANVSLIEFEVCPGLPCFDFRAYVGRVWGMHVTEAMARVAARRLSVESAGEGGVAR